MAHLRHLFCLFALCWLIVFSCAQPKAQAENPTPQQLEFFEKEVRPLLVAHCYSCHSHQAKKLKGDLHLDSRAGLLKGGESGPALVPGNLDESLLIDAVRYETYQMPPKGKLPDDQIAILEKWVAMGAPWPKELEPVAEKPKAEFDLAKRKAGMWSLQPITSRPVPTVKDQSWPASDIDRFILSALEEQQLSPAPDVDRRTLIRRLYFDLIGLPPTPEQLARHLQDTSADPIPTVVDELLASPHFGERWGRHWLDLVRYAESRGHEFDSDAPNAWQYRDYVIRALNADLPYDQFVREHIAGDLLTEPRLNPETNANESILGTGFWHLGEWVHSPVDIRKDETDRFDNMIDVMSKTFLGLTVSCARCHDHKFDAISAKDYYALTGFLQGCDFREAPFASLEPNRHLAADLEKLQAEFQSRFRDSLLSLLKPDTRWLEKIPDLAANPPAWLAAKEPTPIRPPEETLLFNFDTQTPPTFTQDGAIFKHVSPGELLVHTESGKPQLHFAEHGSISSDPFWKPLQTLPPQVTNHRGELGKFPRSGRTFHTPTFQLKSDTVSCLVRGSGHVIARVDSHSLLSGPLHMETIRHFTSPDGTPLHWVTLPLGRYIGHNLHLEFTPADDCRLDVLEIWNAPPPADQAPPEKLPEADIAKQLSTILTDSLTTYRATPDNLTSQHRTALVWLIDHLDSIIPPADRAPLDNLLADYSTKQSALASKIKQNSPVAMAMLDGTGENDHLLIRGSSANPGPEIPRRFLEALDGPDPLAIPQGSGRLELAARINDPRNPLTSRVIVNRLWLHLFGRGIVPTPDDFGNLGQPPTNLPLLDHLAIRFRSNGLSLKRMIRELVLSRTYRMSGQINPVAQEKDPRNLLWHHLPPRRLEGEIIRDSLLSVSGKLDPQLFGPSIPIHLTNFMEGRGRPGASGPEDGANRRSIYIAIRRNFLSPFMLAFDTPVPFSTMGRRNVSNVPAQALILMNDPFVIAQARHWSDRALSLHPSDPAARIRWLYESAFARLPTSTEEQLAQQFIETQIAERGVTRADPALWADLAHALINVKEFIFIP